MSNKIFKNFSGEIKRNQNLAKIAAYKIGGNARYLLIPENDDDVEVALLAAKQAGLPFFVLGSGTNLLISDQGFDGLVLWMGPRAELSPRQIKVLREDAKAVEIRVPAYFAKAQLLDFALRKKWGGLEFSAGIPGSLGGAVYMNAGTKWGSYGEVITRVHFFSLTKGRYTLEAAELGFRYRGHGEGLLDGETVVTSVELRLNKTTPPEKILATVDEIYSYRGQRQPLELPNCGSVFKNPPNSERGAGRLIEAAELKGLRVRDAEVSQKHANFILNRGHAKARDVDTLIRKIQEKVSARFGITLEPEVIRIGKF